MAAQSASTIDEDLELLRSSAVAAGIIAAGYFRREVKTWTKENASPVTEADYMVDSFLKQSLLAARPDYGWLSEETTDDPSRLSHERLFVVDPIDGTRAFIRGDDCWSVSLAVVENGVSVAGVVYAPARDELYAAMVGGGAFVNGRPLERQQQDAEAPIIPAPAAVHAELDAQGLEYVGGTIFPSLAYRLVQVATGALDVAISRRGAQDWDIAGADVILSECGVGVEDVCVGRPVYNKPEIRHGALAAMHDLSLKQPVHAALVQIYGCPAPDNANS